MKIHSMICAFALVAAASAAVVTGSNTGGLMNVPGTSRITMIAVPWVNVGGGDVEVAKLVKTDTLTAGDELYYYDGASYNRWVLNADKTWAPSAISNAQGTFVSPDAGLGIARGQGLILVRQSTASEIWVYGQHDTAAVSVKPAAGTTAAPAYTMIANPNTAAYDLNAQKAVGAAGDQIVFPGTTELYTCNGTAWTKIVSEQKTIGTKTITVKKPSADGVVIPAGRGAWYVSKGGSPTTNW